MYWQVYLHQAAVAADVMLVSLIKRAKELCTKGIELQATPALAYFLNNDFNFDDSSLAFLDTRSGHALADRKSVSSCIPKLIEGRRSGQWERKRWAWQSQALTSFTKRPSIKGDHRRKWRPVAKRSIPFTQLGTPPSEAILALERNGSYVLSLGAKRAPAVLSP